MSKSTNKMLLASKIFVIAFALSLNPSVMVQSNAGPGDWFAKLLGSGESKPKCHHQTDSSFDGNTSFCSGTVCTSSKGAGSKLAKCG